MNNTAVANLTSNVDDVHQPSQQSIPFIFDLRFFLVRIFYPCLLMWGTIGNSLCLRVLLSKKFYKNSTCQYLAILAVIDILFIVMRSSKHIYKLFRDTTIFNTSKWVCRILTFFSSALAHLASWILVIVSFDRYLIVTSRYRRHGSAAIRVFYSTMILIAIVVLCNLYYFFILGRSMSLGAPNSFDHRRMLFRILLSTASNDTASSSAENLTTYSPTEFFRYKTSTIFVCIPSAGFEHLFRTYIPIFDILIVAVIPFLFLCFTNIGIIIFTMHANRHMRQHRKRSHRRHQRLTIMLLSVTLAFIGLTCPSVIFICVSKIIYSGRLLTDRKDNSGVSLGQPSQVQLLLEVCEALWYTKHAMNFILYTLSGSDFRREFIKLFTQWCNPRSFLFRKILIKNETITTTTTTTTTTAGATSLTGDTQLRVVHTHKKTISRKKVRRPSISDTQDISTSVMNHSNSLQFKPLTDEK